MNKLIPLLTSSIVFAAGAFAAEAWQTNVDDAINTAKKENKIAFVEFTGSDWCPPCKHLRGKIFPTDTFKKYADGKFVLVELDFPRNSDKLTEEAKAYNERQRQKYEVTGFPTVVLIGADGRPFAKKVGSAANADAYVKSIDELVAVGQLCAENFTTAGKLSGIEKAKKLDAGLALIPKNLRNFYGKEVEALIAADPKDTLGIAAKYLEEQKLAKQQKDVLTLKDELRTIALNRPNANTTPPDKALFKKLNDKVDEFLARKDLLPIIRQEVLYREKYSLAYSLTNDLEAMVPYLEEIVKIDPTNQYGTNAKKVLQTLETIRKEKAAKTQPPH